MAKTWTIEPELLDVAWCRFPEKIGADGGASVPGPKPRPSLVLEVNDKESPAMLHMAFGTSQKTDDLHAGEFQISKEDGDVFAESGCDDRTKFDLRRTVWLPYDANWFGKCPTSKSATPIIGHIDINKSIEVRKRLSAASKVFHEEQKARKPAKPTAAPAKA